MEIILNKYIWYSLICFFDTPLIIFDILLICFFDTPLIISLYSYRYFLDYLWYSTDLICFHNNNILTLPLKVSSEIIKLNLLRTRVNVLPVTALVKMSANWFSDFTNGSSILLSSIFSLMECLSNLTCLVLSCCTRLFVFIASCHSPFLLASWTVLGIKKSSCNVYHSFSGYLHRVHGIPRNMLWRISIRWYPSVSSWRKCERLWFWC